MQNRPADHDFYRSENAPAPIIAGASFIFMSKMAYTVCLFAGKQQPKVSAQYRYNMFFDYLFRRTSFSYFSISS